MAGESWSLPSHGNPPSCQGKYTGLASVEGKKLGLNRAIFYEAAKRGFKRARVPVRRPEEIRKKSIQKTRRAYFLGNEMAYVSRKGNRTYFAIGGESQTEVDFKRQIESRFGNTFPRAWAESLHIVNQYPKEILLSQGHFFRDVYKPRRDELASKWTKMST